MHDGSRVAFLADWGNSGLDFTKRETKTHFIVAAGAKPFHCTTFQTKVIAPLRDAGILIASKFARIQVACQ